MKYKVLLIGRNKMLMEDFFVHLEEDFEMQTASMRYKDIVSHIHYFEPDALIFCMNKEEKERMNIVISLKNSLENHKVTLVVTGDQSECDEFSNKSGGMEDLLLYKPITARSIKERVVKFLDTRKEEVAEEPAPAKKHVLVVDDDPMMLKLIKEQLKDSYTVATAINGAIALKFLESKQTDLILLDYEMPNENGAQVLEKIRKNPAIAKLPVVFLTGIKDREKIKRVVELKPQGYLLKPIESEELIKSIKSIIG